MYTNCTTQKVALFSSPSPSNLINVHECISTIDVVRERNEIYIQWANASPLLTGSPVAFPTQSSNAYQTDQNQQNVLALC